MTRSETLGIVASGLVGPVTLLLWLSSVVTTDTAFSIIGFTFALALVPGVIENFRKKIGWSKRSCILTGNNLWSMSVIFLLIGYPITALSEFLSAAMWTTLLVQAFVYAKKAAAPPEKKVPHCAECHTPMRHVPGIGDYCPNQKCDNADGPVCTEENPDICKRLLRP